MPSSVPLPIECSLALSSIKLFKNDFELCAHFFLNTVTLANNYGFSFSAVVLATSVGRCPLASIGCLATLLPPVPLRFRRRDPFSVFGLSYSLIR